jgi:hypothetical protein
MKAKCPHCEAGCPKCKDGFVEVSFGSGPLYTRACLNGECGYENGGYIVQQDRPKGPDGEPPEFPRECVLCKSPCRWKYLGEM